MIGVKYMMALLIAATIVVHFFNFLHRSSDYDWIVANQGTTTKLEKIFNEKLVEVESQTVYKFETGTLDLTKMTFTTQSGTINLDGVASINANKIDQVLVLDSKQTAPNDAKYYNAKDLYEFYIVYSNARRGFQQQKVYYKSVS